MAKNAQIKLSLKRHSLKGSLHVNVLLCATNFSYPAWPDTCFHIVCYRWFSCACFEFKVTTVFILRGRRKKSTGEVYRGLTFDPKSKVLWWKPSDVQTHYVVRMEPDSSACIDSPSLVFTMCIEATLFPDSAFIIYLCTGLSLWWLLMSFGLFLPYSLCHLIVPHSLLCRDVFTLFFFIYLLFYIKFTFLFIRLALCFIMWTC